MAMQENPEKSIKQQIVEYLLTIEHFNKTSLKMMFGLGAMSQRDWGLLFHDAMQDLVEMKRVFIPSGSSRYKLAGSVSTYNRASKFSRAALRKMDRATKLALTAVELADDPEDKRRLERAALRQANRAVNARYSLNRASTTKPKGVENT